MLNKKDVLLLSLLLEKRELFLKDQTVFSQNHKNRLIRCINKLKTYGLLRQVKTNNGLKIVIDEFKGDFIGRVLVGFGVLSGDNDFKGKKAIL